MNQDEQNSAECRLHDLVLLSQLRQRDNTDHAAKEGRRQGDL